MTNRCRFAVVLTGLALLSAAAEPARLPGENPRSAQRFAEAAAREQTQRWTEAVEAYQRLIDDSGDDLVPLEGNRQYVPARWLAHRRLAAQPELLAAYRSRVDARARRLLEQGQQGRDAGPLTRLVEDLFCSRPTETALHLLGDLAFERGDFTAAMSYWRSLDPPMYASGPTYPGPAGDPALVRAKLILARLFLGERGGAEADLQRFRQAHAQAIGYLAGRQGNLAGILGDLFKSPDVAAPPARSDASSADATFAGAVSRDGLFTTPLPPQCPRLPSYDPLPIPGGQKPAPVPETHLIQRPLARPSLICYPVIVRGHVLAADCRSVVAFDLATGRPTARYECDTVARGDAPPADFRTTLTVVGDRVYARFGRPRMQPVGEDDSVLVCLHFRPEVCQLNARWTLPAPKNDAQPDAAPLWEGAPLIRDGKLYAAVTRFDGNRATTAIACYEADDPRPGPLWVRDVCEVTAQPTDGPRGRQELLTLAGPLVVLCSHAGTITAVDATTGRRAWAARYPARAVPTDFRPQRDLAPPVYADGKLFVAPADAERLFCLDVVTGATIWESAPLEVVHLLGVAQGRVICTKGGFMSGIVAVRADDGRIIPDWGYEQPTLEGAPVLGRGVLTPERIYWPTRYGGLLELRHDDGKRHDAQPLAFAQLPGGNLALGDGGLVIATGERLHLLVNTVRDGTKVPQAAGRAGNNAAPPGFRLAANVVRAASRRESISESRSEALGWPLERIARTSFPSREQILTDDLLLATDNGIVRRNSTNGRVRWRQTLPFAAEWAEKMADGAVVAGPYGVAYVRNDDGSLVWAVPPPPVVHERPESTPPGWRCNVSTTTSTGKLSGFQLAGGRLFAFVNGASLLAFDAATGALLWRRQAPAVGLPGARRGDQFFPHYLAAPDFVVLQTTDGHRWTLDAATGQTLQDTATSEDAWPDPPLAIDDRRAVVAESVAGGEPAILMYDLADGYPIWRFALPRWPSLTHELPRLRRDGDRLLVCVGRNYGTELERLDLMNGRPTAPALLLSRGPVDPGAVTVVGPTVVVADGDRLRGLTDRGKIQWLRPLTPGADWRLVRAGERTVIAHPARAVPMPVGYSFEAWAVDAATGDVAKHWDFAPRGPRAALAVDHGSVTVRLDGEVSVLAAAGREKR